MSSLIFYSSFLYQRQLLFSFVFVICHKKGNHGCNEIFLPSCSSPPYCDFVISENSLSGLWQMKDACIGKRLQTVKYVVHLRSSNLSHHKFSVEFVMNQPGTTRAFFCLNLHCLVTVGDVSLQKNLPSVTIIRFVTETV